MSSRVKAWINMLVPVLAMPAFVPGLRHWPWYSGALLVVPIAMCVIAGSYPWKGATYRDRWAWGFVQSVVLLLLYLEGNVWGRLYTTTTDLGIACKAAIFLSVYSCAFMGVTQGVASFWLRRRRDKHESSLVCSSCGYNLTGNVSGICPECGTPVRR